MDGETIFSISLALALGVLFFVVDLSKHESRIHASLIGGISLSYFFLVVLPEVSRGIPEYPAHLENFEYLFVLIGFSVNHISEKLILQKVEFKRQKKMRDLIIKEQSLELVEGNIEDVISIEMKQPHTDFMVLKELAQTLSGLHDQEHLLGAEIQDMKVKIHDHVNQEMEKFRSVVNYFYHFLIGVILINLIQVNLLGGILFFIFAFFMTIISNQSRIILVFTELEIEVDLAENSSKIKRVFMSSAGLMGIFLGLIIDVIFNINLEFLYLLFSFIAGVISYVILRELIPTNEKGKPLLFLIGAGSFAVFVYLVKILEFNL